ncbi:SnoaL-like protein [Tahibacter aquaticus]|jgi:ketosteroid isomerase-like protein|uniref:SnoaL-like protein n=1 Tax=Tahibacter aquaticus TaxID=520092 RepID=A0A4R6Z0H1_9GAMM|nr:nuclear transport factor 2 family protein [Tahibacter aquaticus]TDR45023.1 SnoaL-like protein [Tahibacter aquaticus]
MKRIAATVWTVVLLVCSGVAFAQTAPAAREADHEALRGLMRTASEAVNTRKFDLLTPQLHAGFTVIAVDNTKLVGIEAFRSYWNKLFDGADAPLLSVETKPAADELTFFLDDNVGVVYGTSQDTYTFRKNAVFKQGEQRSMTTRWSAAVVKEGDSWKLVNVHFSANPFDNPMLQAAADTGKRMAVLAGVGGLLLGLLLMALLRRRR